MKKEWTFLAQLTGNKAITVEKVRIDEDNVAIEGSFDLPPLSKLSFDEQVFVAVFVKCHGSIKEMEKHFGVSYPAIKNRLNRIGAQLDFVEVEETSHKASPIDLLEQGELTVEETIKLLEKGDKNA